MLDGTRIGKRSVSEELRARKQPIYQLFAETGLAPTNFSLHYKQGLWCDVGTRLEKSGMVWIHPNSCPSLDEAIKDIYPVLLVYPAVAIRSTFQVVRKDWFKLRSGLLEACSGGGVGCFSKSRDNWRARQLLRKTVEP